MAGKIVSIGPCDEPLLCYYRRLFFIDITRVVLASLSLTKDSIQSQAGATLYTGSLEVYPSGVGTSHCLIRATPHFSECYP